MLEPKAFFDALTGAGVTLFAGVPDSLLKDFCANRMKARGSEAHATFLPLFLLSADLLQWYRRSVK